MTKNKKLKSRVKKYMRGGPLLDEDTGNPVIDPDTKKVIIIPPKSVTALDIMKKFDRKMTLDEAIHFLRVLEQNDKMITSSPIEDLENNGVDYTYHYKHRKRKRGDRE